MPLVPAPRSSDPELQAMLNENSSLDEGEQLIPEDKSTSRVKLKALEQQLTRTQRAVKQRRIFVARLRAPVWFSLTRRALEICGYRSPSGWNFTIQTYYVVPWYSDIFDLIQEGNISGTRDLFERREASPFDQDEDGRTVLQVSLLFPIL
jgi:hypothetical protein